MVISADFDVEGWLNDENDDKTARISIYEEPASAPKPAPSIYDIAKKTTFLSDIYQDNIALIPNKSGGYIGSCQVPGGCKEGSYSVHIQDVSTNISSVIELTEAEAAAFLAIRSTANAGTDTTDREFLNGISMETRLAASLLAEKTVSDLTGSSVNGSLVKEQFLNSTGFISSHENLSQELVDYSSALNKGDLSGVIIAREALYVATVQDFLETGLSDEDAAEMAVDYMNIAYDQPILTGKDPHSILSNASPLGLPSNSLSPNEFVAVMAVDSAVKKDEEWLTTFLSEESATDFEPAKQTAQDTFYDIKNKTQVFKPNSNTSPASAAEILSNSSLNIPVSIYHTPPEGLTPSPVITITGTNTTGGAMPTGNAATIGDLQGWVNDITMPKSDLVYIMLKRLLGGPIESIYDYLIDSSTGKFKTKQGALVETTSSAPTATLFVITSILFIVLTISGVLVTYLVIYGAYKSAKDGELLGKEWNTYWTPARSMLSAAMVFPIPAVAGMSGIQVFVILCVFFGTSIASGVAYYSSRLLMSAPVIDPVPSTNESFVSSMAKGHACMAIMATEDSSLNITTTAPRELVIDGKGNVPGNTGASLPPTSPGAFGYFTDLISAGTSDPLTDSSDMSATYEAIGRIYKQTGLNPLTTKIKRYQFGDTGQCGSVFLPFQTVDYEMEDIPELIAKEKWPNRLKPGRAKSLRSHQIRLQEEAATGETYDLGKYSADIKADSEDTLSIKKLTKEGSRAWRNTILNSKYHALDDAMKVLNRNLENSILGYLGHDLSRSSDHSNRESNLNSSPDISDLGDSDSEGSEETYTVKSDGDKNPGLLAVKLTNSQRIFYDTLSKGVTEALLKAENPGNGAGLEAIDKLGWMSLGSVYWIFEHRQTELMAFYSFEDLPTLNTRKGVSYGSDADDSSNSLREVSVEAVERYESISKVIDAGIGPTGIRLAAQLLENGSDRSSEANIGHKISNLIAGNLINGTMLADSKNLNVSPIERVRHLGVTVMNGYAAAVTTMAIIKATAAGFKSASNGKTFGTVTSFLGGFAESIIGSIISLLTEISGPLLTSAFLCANIIPAMPYLMFTAASIGYLIYVMEALIGSNFWMMMHSHPDGHDIWGKGGGGYSIIFTLILRPLFIVIGFFIGIGINWVFGHFINISILPSMDIQNSGGWFGNISEFAGTLAIFSAMHIFAAYKSFSLTWELPNALTRWMGVDDHQDLGEREAKEGGLAVAAPMGSSIGRATLGIGAGGSPKNPDPRDVREGEGEGEEDPNALRNSSESSSKQKPKE
ncbi:MAG: DotA/TraY family protein [Colwellia sp.]